MLYANAWTMMVVVALDGLMVKWFAWMSTEHKFVTLRDVGSYHQAFELSNVVWEIVLKWQFFAQKTIGDQFVRAVDSISANISEGFGRYHKKDKIKFYYYARGSVLESLDWLAKANIRNLLTLEQYQTLNMQLHELPKSINTLIKITNEKLAD